METVLSFNGKLNYFKNQRLNGTISTLASETQKRMVSLKTRFLGYYTNIVTCANINLNIIPVVIKIGIVTICLQNKLMLLW